ncbi:hypothetical protein MATR_20160 [Marivirga tractuosa]|uniref:Uncharacterized protein n=1 Tax=Marivirga tractuosa (strain ATCC 23168 / DSM 4126 / NBRC 15989 / NCIMB 1408 / VKM B-1430 / H-43) TaxID=643867 RepID=E4TMR7_MARTH|nr:outer membrane beta-barrel protein [Marivirga tractuosa]ADR20365.1 hypothetical protein Ftrac_0358 [Marivirga tractuosa DSM 4126]BDD15191.1 hypothetical protein MATR_20160 [Marivirga tractuosa]
MKLSCLIILPIILLFSIKATAQSKFYIATEGNFIYDLYQVTDEGRAVGPSNIRTLDIPGVSIITGYELNSIFSVETGMAIRPVKSGFSLIFNEGGRRSEGGGAYYHIPVRTRARIPLLSDWLYATASLGVNLSVTDPTRLHITEEFGSESGGSAFNGSEWYSYDVVYTSYNKAFLTAAAETGFDLKISPKFQIYSTLNYNRGFTDLKRTDIQYKYRSEAERSASVLHEGSYISVNIGLRFHLNTKDR